MITINNKNYYTTKELADKLNLHLRTIQRWVREKKLIPFKFGPKKFYYDDNAIENCIRGNSEK